MNSKTVKAMKTRNYLNIFAIGAAAMMVLGGCAKEIENYENIEKPGAEDNAPVAAVVSAGIESADTKTYMGDAEEVDGKKVRKVYWENGDQISINGTTSTALAEVGENATSAEFGFTTTPETPYKAVYPASIWSKVEGDNTLVSLPKEYASAAHASKASFAQNALPMAAYSAEGGDLTFKHLCAVLKLSLTGDKTIDYVEFRGNNGEKVSSTMYLTCTEDGVELSYNAVEDYQKVVKVQVDKTLPTDIYIAVPVTYQKDAGKATAGVFSKGFTVTVVDTEGALMTKSVTESRTFTPGKLINMPVLAYAPTEDGSAKLPWKIDTAEEWLAMATAKRFEDPAAHYILTADLDFKDKNFVRVNPFMGTLDGQGHKFFNLVHSMSGNSNMGLVDDNKGVMKNFTVEAEFTGKNQFGGVAGKNNGTLDNVFFKGKITSTGYYVGGVCGLNNKTILNSGFISGEVKSTGTGDGSDKNGGSVAIGGLCGYNKGTIANSCVQRGTVTHEDGTNSGNKNAGGLVGHNNAGVIINCYSWVEKVTSASNAGGLLGYGHGSGNIVNCYSTCTDLTSKRANGTRSATVAYLNGHTARNVYGPAIDSKLVITKWDEKSNSADEINAVSAVLTAAQLANTGTVTVPTLGAGTGTCDNFVAALNKGVEISEAPAGITLKTWVADPVTGYPVLAE